MVCRLWIGVLFVLAACLGCGGGSNNSSPTAPTPSVPFSSTDLVAGTGTEAAAGRVVTVEYAGWLYNSSAAENKGQLFDTSSNRSTPFTFTLGAGAVIRGWDQGVPGMKVGGLRRLVIPPELGYGSRGAGGGLIPPNATLVFEIQLLDVQ